MGLNCTKRQHETLSVCMPSENLLQGITATLVYISFLYGVTLKHGHELNCVLSIYRQYCLTE
jgi:hypothetical protein